MWFTLLFILLLITSIHSEYDRAIKKLFWIPNTEGLFSQFLQMKVVYHFALMSNRQLFCEPFASTHFDKKYKICDIFELPSLSCTSDKSCLPSSINNRLDSVAPSVCLKSSIPTMGGDTRRDTFLHAIKFADPPFIIHKNFDKSIAQFIANLGLNVTSDGHISTSLTVVHWRRGDQIKSRCHQTKDQSVNCGTANELVQSVRSHSNNSVVYVATNEGIDSLEMSTLVNAGFKIFKDGLSKDLDVKPESLTGMMIDAALMINCTTLLAWGVSIINDIIEHQRMLDGKSYCLGYSEVSTQYPTWCWLHHQESKPSNKHIVDNAKIIGGIPFLVLSDLNTSHMPSYETERKDNYGRAHLMHLKPSTLQGNSKLDI